MLSSSTDVPFTVSLLTAFSTLPGTALIVEEIAPNQPEMELLDSSCQNVVLTISAASLLSPKCMLVYMHI